MMELSRGSNWKIEKFIGVLTEIPWKLKRGLCMDVQVNYDDTRHDQSPNNSIFGMGF
jgi:hypothetical protein